MSLVFLCLGFILTLFEEINFFKDYDVGIKLPLVLSMLFVPGLLYNMFPFVILLSGIWFFLKIKKTDEIIAIKISGMSNFSVIILPSIMSIILGIFFVTSVNPMTSFMIKKYESIKDSLDHYLDTWKKYNREFIDNFYGFPSFLAPFGGPSGPLKCTEI